MNRSSIAIGRLLSASSRQSVVGCRLWPTEAPSLGSLLRIPLENELEIYGIVCDMQIAGDGLVRQLVTAPELQPEVFADQRANRSVPVELSVLHLGYRRDDVISHLLPPRPPLSLDEIFLCTDAEICAFTSAGRFGYLRHMLRAQEGEWPVDELLAAHLQQAGRSHQQSDGDAQWRGRAVQELIVLLRDDYPSLMAVLSALADAV